MGIYIEPSNINKVEANKKTMLKNNSLYAKRVEYLKNHTIAETLKYF